MENETTKKWYQSKTLWAVICTAIVTICQGAGVDLPEWLIPSLITAGLLFARTGKKLIK